MTMTTTTTDEITCPSCGVGISVTERLRSPLRAELAAELRPEIERVLRAEHVAELADLCASVEKLTGENADLRDRERQLRSEREDLRRKEDDFDLLLARAVDQERKELLAEAEVRLAEKYQLKLKERDETIGRMKKDLEAAHRRSEQGSSELKGTAQEVALHEELRAAFPEDDIARAPRGRAGADVTQRVRSRSGEVAGTILWESKRAKQFSRGWVATLRENTRAVRADVGVLVTSVVPDGKPITESDGVWVVSFALAGVVGAMLRQRVLAVARARAASEQREDLAGTVYDYVTSSRFRDLVTGAIEPLAQEIRAQQQEQNALTRRNAQRWQFLQQQAERWASLVGDLEGLGAELPAITPLELPPGN